jgi:hypothetical protein
MLTEDFNRMWRKLPYHLSLTWERWQRCRGAILDEAL